MREPVHISTISTGAINGNRVAQRRSLGAVVAIGVPCMLVDDATGRGPSGCVLASCAQAKSATATPYPSTRLCTRTTSPICSRFTAPALGSWRSHPNAHPLVIAVQLREEIDGLSRSVLRQAYLIEISVVEIRAPNPYLQGNTRAAHLPALCPRCRDSGGQRGCYRTQAFGHGLGEPWCQTCSGLHFLPVLSSRSHELHIEQGYRIKGY